MNRSCRRCALATAAVLLLGGAARVSHAGGMGALLDCYWTYARDQLHDAEAARRNFTDAAHESLWARAREVSDLDSLAAILNPFFDRVGMSHFYLLTPSDLAYHVYDAFGRDIDSLPVPHVGLQCTREPAGWRVRSVLEGYPAERAGLRRGDLLVAADGRAFHPLRSFQAGTRSVVSVRRNGRPLLAALEPVVESIPRSFLNAMRNSVRDTVIRGHRIGYVHLWVCTYGPNASTFTEIVTGSLAGCEGIVLDLRDGFGGGWIEYLDPFFADRAGYPAITATARDGVVRATEPGRSPPHESYRGPLVALINEGSRSGKEVVAAVLGRSRARLVGTTTMGAFLGGGPFRCAGERGILVVPGTALKLGDRVLEDAGVAPHVAIPYPVDRTLPRDPQRERAFEELLDMLDRRR